MITRLHQMVPKFRGQRAIPKHMYSGFLHARTASTVGTTKPPSSFAEVGHKTVMQNLPEKNSNTFRSFQLPNNPPFFISLRKVVSLEKGISTSHSKTTQTIPRPNTNIIRIGLRGEHRWKKLGYLPGQNILNKIHLPASVSIHKVTNPPVLQLVREVWSMVT